MSAMNVIAIPPPTPRQERFKGLVPVLSVMRSLVVGCGSLGSHLITMLARKEPLSITFVDHDVVERVNLGTQNFSESDIGVSKTQALQKRLEGQTRIKGFPMSFADYMAFCTIETADQFTHIFMCVDSMATRREIFSTFMAKKYAGLIIDGRLDANVGWIYAVNTAYRRERTWFDKTLHSDEEVISVAHSCAVQMTGYSAPIIAGLMLAQAMRHSQDPTLPPEQCGIDLNNMLFFRTKTKFTL